MTISRSYLKKLIKEEAKSIKQQKLMGMALKCKKTGDCASEKVKKMANDMKTKDLKDFASTSHEGLPEKVENDDEKEKNELKQLIRDEVSAILGETWSSTAPGGTRHGASTGIESVTPLGIDRAPTPPSRHRMHDKPYDPLPRGPNVNYGQELAPWKVKLLKKALFDVRMCGGSEQQAGHVQKMLRFVLENYEDDEQPNETYGSQLVSTVVNRFCSRNS